MLHGATVHVTSCKSSKIRAAPLDVKGSLILMPPTRIYLDGRSYFLPVLVGFT